MISESQVVFVLGAWNFPFHLSLAPCIAAIAAGNCVVLKPSDVSPTCAQMLKEAWHIAGVICWTWGFSRMERWIAWWIEWCIDVNRRESMVNRMVNCFFLFFFFSVVNRTENPWWIDDGEDVVDDDTKVIWCWSVHRQIWSAIVACRWTNWCWNDNEMMLNGWHTPNWWGSAMKCDIVMLRHWWYLDDGVMMAWGYLDVALFQRLGNDDEMVISGDFRVDGFMLHASLVRCTGKYLGNGAFHGHGGAPSHHPYFSRLFPFTNTIQWSPSDGPQSQPQWMPCGSVTVR